MSSAAAFFEVAFVDDVVAGEHGVGRQRLRLRLYAAVEDGIGVAELHAIRGFLA